MFKKLKNFDTKYSSLFFCISLLVLVIFFAYSSVNNRNKTNECVIPNKLVNNYTNYSYDVTYTKEDKEIALYIKRYDSKYLIEKLEDGVKSSYFLHYTDVLEKNTSGDYVRFRDYNIIDGLDNKYLLLDYINDISLESKITTDKELTCYINRKLELSMCINLDDSITLKGNDYILLYEIKEKGNVSDFDVNVNLDYVENNIEDNLIDSNIQ